jgi:hypothetical protein
MLLYGLGAVRQFAFVVNDIRAAMNYWTSVMGVGPFFYFEQAPVKNLKYKGVASAAKLSVAFANTGSMQIELIQPLDDHPSIFRDFRRLGLEGHQHVSFWTTALDRWVEQCERAGVAVLQSGHTGAEDGRFVFVAAEHHPGVIVEISEVQGWKAQFFSEVARAAEGWGGKDPVRKLES